MDNYKGPPTPLLGSSAVAQLVIYKSLAKVD
jgi:hypothetical protein